MQIVKIKDMQPYQRLVIKVLASSEYVNDQSPKMNKTNHHQKILITMSRDCLVLEVILVCRQCDISHAASHCEEP